MRKTVSAHVYNTIERYPQIIKTPKVEKAMGNFKCRMALRVNRGLDNSSYNKDRIAPSGFLEIYKSLTKISNGFKKEHPMIMDSCNFFDRYDMQLVLHENNHEIIINRHSQWSTLWNASTCSTCLNPKNGMFFFAQGNL